MPIRRVLQAGAVILLAALIGLFAKSVIDNQTSIAADVADGGHPMAPNFTLQNVNGQGTTIVQVTHSEVNAAYGNRIVQLEDGWIAKD